MLKMTAWVWSWGAAYPFTGRAVSCSNFATTNLRVISAGWLPPIRACVYRSSSSKATRILSRWATRMRWSPPTSAVNETDFGAENVASQPARCSTEVTVFPFSALYSCASRCRTSCSPVPGCCPWLSLANSSFGHRSGQSIFGGQTSLPFTLNSIALGPIALLSRGEFLLVIALRLLCREWLGNCQHAFNSQSHQSLGPRLQRCAQERERALAQALVPVVPVSSERSGHPWGAPRIQGASLQGRRTETRIVPRGCRISGNPGDRRDRRFLRASRGARFGGPA